MKIPLRQLHRSNALTAPNSIPDVKEELVVGQNSGDASETSSVDVAYSLTDSMGDFKFVKVSVSVSIPCRNDPLERKKAIEQASAELGYYLPIEMATAKERFYQICGYPATQ